MALLRRRQATRRWPLRWAVLAAVVLFTAEDACATTPEFQVKAAYLFNFARYVEWPPDAFRAPNAPLIIAIVGDDPFGSTLDDLVRGEEAQGHPLLVQRYRRVEDVQDCHILFVSRLGRTERETLLSGLKNRSILTVSDTDDFARQGGMIRFVMADGRVRMQINWEAAKRANLTMSSKLLRSAQIVDGEETRG